VNLSGWALGRPSRLGLLHGVSYGSAMGAIYAIKGHNPYDFLVAVPGGVIFGLAMRYILKRRDVGPSDLTPYEGRKVIAAVRRGEPIDDPALARGVVQLADVVTRRQPAEKYTLPTFAALALLSFLFVVVDLMGGNAGGAAWLFLALLFWVAVSVWWPRWRRRQVRHAQEARAHAISHL
jgi:hypothetical protein